jgi:hypothetical protein
MPKTTKKKEAEVERVIHAFYDHITSVVFQRAVKNLREKLNVPPNGFTTFTKEDSNNFINANYDPSEWKPPIPKQSTFMFIDEMMQILLQKMGQDSLGLRSVLRVYFFHNYVEPEILHEVARRNATVTMVDNVAEFGEYNSGYVVLMAYYGEKYKNYPVSIRLNPYASKEQLLSFIDDNWAVMKELQEKYAVPAMTMGNQTRGRKNEADEINLFIAERFEQDNYTLIDGINDKFGVIMSLAQIRSRKHRIKNKS